MPDLSIDRGECTLLKRSLGGEVFIILEVQEVLHLIIYAALGEDGKRKNEWFSSK